VVYELTVPDVCVCSFATPLDPSDVNRFTSIFIRSSMLLALCRHESLSGSRLTRFANQIDCADDVLDTRRGSVSRSGNLDHQSGNG
jgi:hypothetical protein